MFLCQVLEKKKAHENIARIVNTNLASSLNTIRLRFGGKPNQTKTKTKTKPKPKTKWDCVVVVIEEFLIEESLIEEFNRLILCSGIISVSLGSISVTLGSISDRYLYKA